MSLKIPEDTKQTSPTHHNNPPSTPKKSSSIGWILVLGILVVITFAVFIQTEWFDSLKPPKVTNANDYEQFLTRLEALGWTNPSSEKTVTDCPISENQATHSPMSRAECELRQLLNESEIKSALKEIDSNILSVLLLPVPQQFVSEERQISRTYLEQDLTNFGGADFENIVKTQKTLRETFTAFQKLGSQNVNPLSETCRLDSGEYPALYFTCQVLSISHKAQNVLALENEDILPFFSKDDVIKAKFLKQMAEEAKDKVIKIRDKAGVLETFCMISLSQEQIESEIADELKKKGDEDFKEMAEAVKGFINDSLQCAM
jgi:hypothetical protein